MRNLLYSSQPIDLIRRVGIKHLWRGNRMTNFSPRKQIKYLHEGGYVAEVEIELTDSDTGWSPTMSLDTAYKLDDVREALRQGDLSTAAKYAIIYEMKKVAI
jgi:hypothetical protein